MTHYARGRAFEYRIKKQLEKLGYFVIRSAGSHGLVDLVMFGPALGADHDTTLIQAKLTNKITKAERDEFDAFAKRLGFPGVIAYNDKGRIIYSYNGTHLTPKKVGGGGISAQYLASLSTIEIARNDNNES